MDSYIKEWLALENIVLGKFQRSYLTPVSDDNCSKHIFIQCKNEKGCQTYRKSGSNKDICVTETRIKRFAEESSPEIVGKNEKLYRLVYTVKYDGDTGTFVPAEIYYYILLSPTNDIYILFPAGSVFKKDQLTDNPDLKTFLQKLVNTIFAEKLGDGNKVIICGHSMGCVLSLYTGIMIKEQNEVFFNSNIIIIGSAPHKHSDNTHNFSNLKNVIIFVFCTISSDNNYEYDCYADKGIDDLANYTPFTYFTSDEKYQDTIFDYKNAKLITDTTVKYQPIKAPWICDYLHSWDNYFPILNKIYPIKSDEKNNGGRSIKRKARRKRRQTIKHVRKKSEKKIREKKKHRNSFL